MRKGRGIVCCWRRQTTCLATVASKRDSSKLSSSLDRCKAMTRPPIPHASRADLQVATVVRARTSYGRSTPQNVDVPKDAIAMVGFNEKPAIEAIVFFDFEGRAFTIALGISFKVRRGAVAAPRIISRWKPYTSQGPAVSLVEQRHEDVKLPPSFLSIVPPSTPHPLQRRTLSNANRVRNKSSNVGGQSTKSMALVCK